MRAFRLVGDGTRHDIDPEDIGSGPIANSSYGHVSGKNPLRPGTDYSGKLKPFLGGGEWYTGQFLDMFPKERAIRLIDSGGHDRRLEERVSRLKDVDGFVFFLRLQSSLSKNLN